MTKKVKEATTILKKPYKIHEFSCQDSNEDLITQNIFKNKWGVLYFYPKDMTSGCTLEANDFQKALDSFERNHCVVVGVSKDSCATHLKFANKENLTFTLLSDEDGKLCKEFDVWKEKSMYGKKYYGIERSTFLINPSGLVVAEWRKVKVAHHVEDVIYTLNKLLWDKK